METILKKLLESITPYLIDFLLDNRHVLIDFLVREAQKSDNVLDDFIVDAVADYINGL